MASSDTDNWLATRSIKLQAFDNHLSYLQTIVNHLARDGLAIILPTFGGLLTVLVEAEILLSLDEIHCAKLTEQKKNSHSSMLIPLL